MSEQTGGVTLALTAQEAHDVHHALSTTVQLIDAVTAEQGAVPPDAPLAGGARKRLLEVARRLDHERRHHGGPPSES
jgi:hypothetical protein